MESIFKKITPFIIMLLLVLTMLSCSKNTKEISETKSTINKLEDLSGKNISMVVAATFVKIIEDDGRIKNPIITEYNTNPDAILAVVNNKSDAALLDLPVAELYCSKYSNLTVLRDYLADDCYGFGFYKGSSLCGEFSAVIERLNADGTLSELKEKWCGNDYDAKSIPDQTWPGSKGTLNVWCAPEVEPLCYIGDGGKILGLETEIILIIAKELDYHLVFTCCDSNGRVAGIASGKADVSYGALSITDERKEKIDFSQTHYIGAAAAVIRKNGLENSGKESEDSGFFSSLKASCISTFVTESRWKLFVEGLGKTMLITILSAAFGTLIGFVVFLICYSGSKTANKIADILSWLIQGMPTVVLLMVLFYIIFGKSNINGTIISIIGFTITFSNSVFGMLKTSVGAIDRGQNEAALALGYTSLYSFFRIILPQAAKLFLPPFKAELVSLAKATSIVGYIAVQDITKTSDIIRSRTYEAFFPLVVAAIIYYLFGALLTFVISNIQVSVDPEKRDTKSILKGINA